jgi:hypothetical protein
MFEGYTKVLFHTKHGTEGMWVRIIRGDENKGVGELDNDPILHPSLRCGDLVCYADGTDTYKPRFTRRSRMRRPS